jgi:hypothetical protein
MIDLTMWRLYCRTVVHECNNEYAKAYAQAGLAMTDPHEIAVQALYILNNIQHWRGLAAKQIRTNLKQIAKES